MSQNNCPQCGASIESAQGACPYCGAPLPTTSTSAATRRASRKELDAALNNARSSANTTSANSEPGQRFQSSAEAMDAIKAALRAGNKPEALEMYRDYFKTELGDAQTAIEQIEYNLKFETVAVQPDVEKPTSAEPAAPAASRSNVALMASEPAPKGKIPAWVWGCVAAFILLCCVCVLLPALFYALLQNFSFS